MAADPPHCLPFEKLLSGKNEYGACGENVGFPSWYNPKLLKDGQSFAQRYFFGLYYSHALSLLLLLGQTENRRLLYYTGKSETPFKACRRYLATLLQIKLWYETDFESPDLEVRLSISTVRQIHVNVERVLQAKDPKPNFRVPNVLNPETPSTSSKTVPSIWKCFRADLINSNIVQEVEGHKVEPEDRQSKISDNEIPRTPEEKVHCYISQYDMAITQWSFMALPILFPKKLGIRGTKEEDFIGFIHLWAVIGYLLGIQDNYNICLQRDLTECKEYCMDIFTKCMIPELLEVDYETEVMWMALLEGIKCIVPHIIPERLILHLQEDFLEIQCPRMKKLVGSRGCCFNCLGRVVLEPLFYCACFRWFCNWRLRRYIYKACKNINKMDGKCPTLIAEKAYY